MKLDRDTLRQWINFIAIFSAFGMNIYSNLAPPEGLTVGELANTVFRNVLIIPANYAFAIWGVIYLGLISLAIYQVLPRNKTEPHLQQMGYFITISSLAQIIWVFLFQYQFFALSGLFMLIILLSLIALYLRLDIAKKPVSKKNKWLVNIPISIYLAWISIATIVNMASILDYFNWDGWGINGVAWTVIMLTIGTIIALIVTLERKDVAFAGVFIWALIAIAIRHLDQMILVGTAGGLGILLILSIISSLKKSKHSTVNN
ncbi:tryptophan-rich sensory protein [Gloeothece citriformis]|nr:tryptophan-rich sensory protein [Gloeothece citriformis]